MSKSFDHEQLYRWFAQLADRTLSVEDHAHLEALLSQSVEARKLWYQFADMEIGLADWAAIPSSDVYRIAPLKSEARTKNRLSAWGWGAAVSLAGLLVFILWPRSVTESPVRGVAVLSHAAGVTWSSTAETRSIGTVLSLETLQLDQGAVKLDFYSGVQLIVEGPAELRLVSPAEVFLVSGRINVHVPPQASGFTVESRDFQLVDRGTEFGMLVSADRAEVHVFTGKVEIKQENAPQAVRALEQGKATQLLKNEWSEIPPDPQAFVTQTELLRREAIGAETDFARWKNATSELSSDKAWLVHYRLAEDYSQQERIPNDVPGAGAATQGLLVGGEWVAGRWPMKRALQFRGEEDRVRLRVDQKLQAVTLLAWVRVREQRPGLQSIFSADGEAPGSIHWELTADGRLRLALARDLGRDQANWEAVNSNPVFLPAALGQWTLVVTTFDGKSVKHFANGELVGQGAAFTPAALLIGSADLGNFNGTALRHFSGEIDEFAILSRALGEAEIRDLYSAGKAR